MVKDKPGYVRPERGTINISMDLYKYLLSERIRGETLEEALIRLLGLEMIDDDKEVINDGGKRDDIKREA